MELKLTERNIEYQNALDLYRSLTNNGMVPALLMESRTVNLAYGKQSIVAANLALKITGKNDVFSIEALTEQGRNLLGEFSEEDFPFVTSYQQNYNRVNGTFIRGFDSNLLEEQRIRKTSAGSFLRSFLQKFSTDNNYAGLYGGIAYDFVRNFEDIGHLHDKEPGEDFTLFLPGDIYVFDEIKQKGTHYQMQIDGEKIPFESHHLKLNDSSALRLESMPEDEYVNKVASIISDIKNGRFMQCVLSRSISVPLIEDPINSYERLREINPSPYCFFFNFGNGEFLYGSSPEVHAVVEYGDITIRPLAGTIRRSQNPLEDAMLRRELLTNDKELSEHSMLVDLARNEVYRLCEPESVIVTDMFTVEEYPNLYHLASGVRGKLRYGFDSIDAILTTLPAGTLSGAPKVEAMKAIEELETTRRGFYGGVVGYLTFNGDCNTGITIRSVYVNNGFSTVQAGAGIVAGSTPENEAEEVMLKLDRPLKNLESRLK